MVASFISVHPYIAVAGSFVGGLVAAVVVIAVAFFGFGYIGPDLD
jgi:hypothetical protein